MGEGQFHDRFGIHVDLAEAKSRFVNRAAILIFSRFYYKLGSTQQHEADQLIPYFLGVPQGHFPNGYSQGPQFYAGGNFLQTLKVIEALFRALQDGYLKKDLHKLVEMVINESELDLGIEWTGSVFVPKGATLLDRQVVEDVLDWLKAKHLKSVYEPFTKALRHLLESTQDPIRLFDTITDCYEAVEAMAMIVAENKKDLSGNRDSFVARLQVSEECRRMLRETLKKYIEYGNHFRHAKEHNSPRQDIAYAEAEHYVYFSGTILRLAAKTLRES